MTAEEDAKSRAYREERDLAERAQRIRELRRTLAISQERLARELGVSLSTVQRWEKGARPMPAHREKIEKLRAAAEGES